jgi:hypothetical protein
LEFICDLGFEIWNFFKSILLNQTTKTKPGSENPSTTLRTNLSPPEPIAIMGSLKMNHVTRITAH